MEGVTDAAFRHAVAEIGGLGAVCTDFIRVTVSPVPERLIRRRLGTTSMPVPQAVQLMAADERFLAESVANAERAGAAWIDLNFGCPSPTVVGNCAGSALLASPDRLGRLVRSAVEAAAGPVSAKLRAGIGDPGLLRELLQATAEAGAAMVILHARLRSEGFQDPAHWEWLAEAAPLLVRFGIPLVGNGGIRSPEDAIRMHSETGCAAVMAGCGVLADPWLFRRIAGGLPADRIEAVGFIQAYCTQVEVVKGPRHALAKVKQMLRWWEAGGLFDACEERRSELLRARDLEPIKSFLCERRSR